MFEFFGKIKEAISGWKTYIVMTVGILSALVGWSDESMTDIQFIEALFAAIGAMALRAGIAKK